MTYIVDFFKSLGDIISSIVDFIVDFFEGLINFFLSLPDYIEIIFEFIDIIPDFAKAFIIMLISAALIFIVIGRRGT